jgi:hypothetical protein
VVTRDRAAQVRVRAGARQPRTPVSVRRPIREKRFGIGASVLVASVVLAAALACPIQRPAVPPEYYDFRAQLQEAVTDTALVEMQGLSKMRAQLAERLADLAAILSVDSLLADLGADPELYPLSGAIATTIRMELESKDVGGSVRDAFRTADGQRQAVDAILIGLGRALHILESAAGEVRGLTLFPTEPADDLSEFHAARGEYSCHRIGDLVVRGGSSGREADLKLSLG